MTDPLLHSQSIDYKYVGDVSEPSIFPLTLLSNMKLFFFQTFLTGLFEPSGLYYKWDLHQKIDVTRGVLNWTFAETSLKVHLTLTLF